MQIALIGAIVFVAATQQVLSGFGFALVVMPLLTLLIGVKTAAPLVALTGLTLYVINALRLRRAVNLCRVVRLGAGSLLGVPVGVWATGAVDERIVKGVLGAILVGYALYTLARPEVRTGAWLRTPGWIYPAGFLAGCLGGAYNTPGPPVIIYGSLRGWPRDEFRAVLQAFFLVNAALVVASHLAAGHLTGPVLRLYGIAVVALGAGVWVGTRLDRWVSPQRFGGLVATMILILGASLVLDF
jgi:uncharacterized membrane protein YfcA